MIATPPGVHVEVDAHITLARRRARDLPNHGRIRDLTAELAARRGGQQRHGTLLLPPRPLQALPAEPRSYNHERQST